MCGCECGGCEWGVDYENLPIIDGWSRIRVGELFFENFGGHAMCACKDVAAACAGFMIENYGLMLIKCA